MIVTKNVHVIIELTEGEAETLAYICKRIDEMTEEARLLAKPFEPYLIRFCEDLRLKLPWSSQ